MNHVTHYKPAICGLRAHERTRITSTEKNSVLVGTVNIPVKMIVRAPPPRHQMPESLQKSRSPQRRLLPAHVLGLDRHVLEAHERTMVRTAVKGGQKWDETCLVTATLQEWSNNEICLPEEVPQPQTLMELSGSRYL